ncbi:MAG TPA: exodeoxyribonuclease VII small subunit [Aggregatilineales bacterium]|nr:exodeoxyribonuclease VII small subunit [Anaerolineales bacterium]HRE48967.1 exodeoxyribonuclease VII small subunit [Aggregatilineales bacterium]
MTQANDANDVEALDFESAYRELGEVITTLEAGESRLDESVALYERGRALAAHCEALLNAATLRVRMLGDD